MVKGIPDLQQLLLRVRTPPLVGVDIGASAVKCVELSRSKDGSFSLDRYATEPLPKGAIVDGNISNLEAVAEAISRAWTRLGTRVKNVALALPAELVISKKITLPAGLDEELLEMQVENEASQYLPFALDEANLDFQVIGTAPHNPDEDTVLLVASRKANVEDRVAAAQAAGLKPVIVDTEPFAVQTAFEQLRLQLPDQAAGQFLALADISANAMSVSILHDGEVIYTRDHQLGGDHLTQQIQMMYNLSPEEAEIGKRKGGLPDDYASRVLAPFVESVANEVARAIQFFHASGHKEPVTQVLLSGGSATLPGLDRAVAQHTRISTRQANPFVGMGLSSRITARQLQLDAPVLLVACGLALRRFDTP